MNAQGESRHPQSILAVHPGALGDVVMFGHLLAGLGGRTTLVAGGEKGRLLQGLAVAARALDFDAMPMHEVFSDTPLSDCDLPRLLGRHDRLVSCFAGGDPLAGQSAPGKPELRLAGMCASASAEFLPVRPPQDFSGHLLDLWHDLLGLPAAPAKPDPWPVPDEWTDQANRLLTAAGIDPSQPYALLHPGAGSPAKCWPAARFQALAREIAVDTQTAFVIGPVECGRFGNQEARSLSGRFGALVCPPLGPLAAALAGAKLYVGNDSGVSHLAAAVGAPTLALFAPTCPQHFAPIGPAAQTLARPHITDISVPAALAAAVTAKNR